MSATKNAIFANLASSFLGLYQQLFCWGSSLASEALLLRPTLVATAINLMLFMIIFTDDVDTASLAVCRRPPHTFYRKEIPTFYLKEIPPHPPCHPASLLLSPFSSFLLLRQSCEGVVHPSSLLFYLVKLSQ